MISRRRLFALGAAAAVAPVLPKPSRFLGMDLGASDLTGVTVIRGNQVISTRSFCGRPGGAPLKPPDRVNVELVEVERPDGT